MQEIVDGASFEPHPVSGEIDLPGEIPVAYKRIDPETLHSRISLPDYNLNIIYLWCPDDENGGGPGWKVAEILPREGGGGGDSHEDESWCYSIGEANTSAREKVLEDTLKKADKEEQQQSSDDDDEYWARYDATPGRSPSAQAPAPNPDSYSSFRPETSYFDRYAGVQPAMDNDDPSEDRSQIGESSLDGNMLSHLLQRQVSKSEMEEPARTNGYPPGVVENEDAAMSLNHPWPAPTSSGRVETVAKLEQEAENKSSCEAAVKEHITANIKSLARLARSTGMSRADFQSLVKTELDSLGVSDD